MFEIDDIFDDIAKEFKSRFDLIISICDSRSHIEKLFLAKLYRFFYLRHFPVNLLTYDAQTLELEKLWKAESYNPNHDYYKTDKSKGYFTHPLYGLLEKVSGLLIEGITINYKIYPQKPIHNHQRLVYADFAIIVTDKLNKVIGKFIIECDGFQWHNTTEQLTRDNIRSRFLTMYGYTVIRYNRKEINQLNDRDIINLENTIYHSIFNEESDIYKWETY